MYGGSARSRWNLARAVGHPSEQVVNDDAGFVIAPRQPARRPITAVPWRRAQCARIRSRPALISSIVSIAVLVGVHPVAKPRSLRPAGEPFRLADAAVMVGVQRHDTRSCRSPCGVVANGPSVDGADIGGAAGGTSCANTGTPTTAAMAAINVATNAATMQTAHDYSPEARRSTTAHRVGRSPDLIGAEQVEARLAVFARTVSRVKPGGSSVSPFAPVSTKISACGATQPWSTSRARAGKRQPLAIGRVEQQQVERQRRAADRLHRLRRRTLVAKSAAPSRAMLALQAPSPPRGRSRRRSRALAPRDSASSPSAPVPA